MTMYIYKKKYTDIDTSSDVETLWTELFFSHNCWPMTHPKVPAFFEAIPVIISSFEQVLYNLKYIHFALVTSGVGKFFYNHRFSD